MLNNCLNHEAKLLFSKTLHDLAAPLGALNLSIDEIKRALPESGELIEKSLEDLTNKIKYWRLMVAGSDQFPELSDAQKLLRDICTSKNITLHINAAHSYQGVYVRLLLSLCLALLESLPRGGEITVDADHGKIKGQGAKCFLTQELKEGLSENIPDPTSRHAIALLIKDFANQCKAVVRYDYTPTSLHFDVQPKDLASFHN